MYKTTADLLELAEGFLEANDILEHDLAAQVIAELRRVTEPVTDAEVATAIEELKDSRDGDRVAYARLIERLARENAEWKKHDCDKHCSVCELTR
jgi:hypothetical protein